MADLVFYTNPQSRGQTVRWMLEEIGEPYDTEILDYGTTMKQEPYLSINPMGKVPAIVHKGKVVTEVRSSIPARTRVDPDHPISGRTIESISPRGKHLLMAFSGDLVLDNLTGHILPWSKKSYRWVRIQMPKNPNYWASLGGDRNA